MKTKFAIAHLDRILLIILVCIVATTQVTDAKGFQSTDTIQITVNGPCDECADLADLDRNQIVDFTDLAHWANRYLMQTGGIE